MKVIAFATLASFGALTTWGCGDGATSAEVGDSSGDGAEIVQCESAAGAVTCAAAEICLDARCYPRAGLPDSTCGSAPAIDIVLTLTGADPVDVGFGDFRLELAARVVSIDAHTLTLSTEGKSVVIGYDIGSFRLPVAVDDDIAIVWREVRSFGAAHGLMLRDKGGHLLALVDDGQWGSAWYQRASVPLPETGIHVATEHVGCPVEATFCAERIRTALRFSDESGAGVTVAPGSSGTFASAGMTYRAINALAEEFVTVSCTDIGARVSWAVIADR